MIHFSSSKISQIVLLSMILTMMVTMYTRRQDIVLVMQKPLGLQKDMQTLYGLDFVLDYNVSSGNKVNISNIKFIWLMVFSLVFVLNTQQARKELFRI